MYFRLWHGSVQSKAISLFAVASILLTPLTPAYASFGSGSPTIPNSSVFTAQTEEPKIDGSTGAFIQRVPIDIPPGRNGLQPDVALDYNSQRTKDGIVGYGWAHSVPYIERVNKAGSQNLYTASPLTPQTYTSSVDGELALATSWTAQVPTILDSLNLPIRQISGMNVSCSATYNVPSGGTNTLEVVLIATNNGHTPILTQNGASFTMSEFASSSVVRAYYWVGYLAAPRSGTFSFTYDVNDPPYNRADFYITTLKDAAQTSPLDVMGVTSSGSASSKTTTAAP